MAIATAAIFQLHARQGSTVTRFAIDVDVRPLQRKLCLDIVVKAPELPGDRVMAGTALVFKAPVVAVVFQVT